MAYFLYVRKSQEDDGRQVQSIGDQLKIGHELALQRGIEIVQVFEESRSAKRPGRPLFQEMMARIEAGEAEGIIAWHPDRLARNAVDAGTIIDLIDRGKIRDLKFQSYHFENTPEGKWMLNIVLSQSKYFVDKLAIDVKRGIKSKLEKGHYPQQAPVGYRNNKDEHTIIADPERFEMVQRAFQLILKGSYSAPQVLDMMNNEWGFRTLKRIKSGGKPLSTSAFYRMLSNVFYTGLMEHGGQIYPGQHPAMISQLEYDQIQTLIKRKQNITQKKEFDFTGLIRCGVCHCLITAETKRKHYKGTGRTVEYTYYHCTGGRGCSKRSVSPQMIEAQIGELLDKVTLHPRVAQWCLDPARDYHRSESGWSHSVLESLEKTLAGAERRKTNLIQTQLADPEMFSNEEFKEEKKRLQDEINGLQQDLLRAKQQLETVRQTVENVFDFAVNAAHGFKNGDVKLRKEIALRLGIKYFLTLGKLEIKPHPLLVPILTFEPQKSGSGKQKGLSFEADSPLWQGLWEEIRTRSGELKGGFPSVRWESRLDGVLPSLSN